MQRGFYIDLDRCVGCHACEVACKDWKDLPPRALGQTGPRYRKLTEIEAGKFPSVTRVFVSMACMHCGKPACVAVCPAGAISKRPEDGIVVVDKDKCIGCHYCFFACPFGVPTYGDDGTMQKCDMCLERLAEGQQPACVENCLGGALHFGTMDELFALAQEKSAKKLVASTNPSVLISK